MANNMKVVSTGETVVLSFSHNNHNINYIIILNEIEVDFRIIREI